MSSSINSSNTESLFGPLYNDPFSSPINPYSKSTKEVKVNNQFNSLLYSNSLDVQSYAPPGLNVSAKPYNGQSYTPNFSLPPPPPKPYMANVHTPEMPVVASRYIPPGLKPEQLDNELESLASDLESSTSLFTFDEQFKNDNLIMEAPLPRKRSLCHHTETCNNSSCEFTHAKIWYKKQNHFLRILQENKKEIDMILKYRIKTFPKLMPIYTEQLSFHNKLADLAKHFANVTKNDESHLTLDFDSRKQPKKYNEDNQGDYINRRNYVPKKQDEDGDYKGEYNPKRNYVTSYSKAPLSGSTIWRKAGGGGSSNGGGGTSNS
jgi:hypothetical protein